MTKLSSDHKLVTSLYREFRSIFYQGGSCRHESLQVLANEVGLQFFHPNRPRSSLRIFNKKNYTQFVFATSIKPFKDIW